MGCGSSLSEGPYQPYTKVASKQIAKTPAPSKLNAPSVKKELSASPSKIGRQKSNQPPLIKVTSPSEDQIAEVRKLVATASKENVQEIVSEKDIKSILSLSNEYKDPDAYLGLQAPSFDIRVQSRKALEVLTLGSLMASELLDDTVIGKGDQVYDPEQFAQIEAKTFFDLKKLLFKSDEQSLRKLSESLPADVIACTAKLLSNDELIRLCKKLASSKFGTVLQIDAPTAGFLK